MVQEINESKEIKDSNVEVKKKRGRPRIYNFQTVEEYNDHKNQLSKKSYHKIKAEKKKEKEKEKENQTNKKENNDTSQ